MPEQITQKLGFDASAAITSLTNLNQKLGEFRQALQATSGGLRKFEKQAATSLITFRELGKAARSAAGSVSALRVASGGAVPPQVAAQARGASAAMNTLSTASAEAATASKKGAATTVASANKVSTAMAKTGEAGKQAAQTIGISWKTIGRIILAQGVIRGLSLLVSTFNDAQEAAREFSLRVGEISTISGNALGTIDQISEATLNLSRNLGIATDEVAEGLYQTLSNQVVEAGEAIRFETTAAKLSITTHSRLKESINALSSVMNSYQLDVSEVDEVSATLFKTVELGRLRMGEFGDVLGRVSPLTAALGISYKEMAASLAAITQKGVPAHTAITQLTAVTQKLLRPTTKLQELYNEWGVETGPEAIRRFGGLRGVLLKMRDATAGNDKEFADLLGRVRSMVGAMNLTTNGADALTHALKEMEDPTDDLDAAFARMESTIGRRSVKAWDDLDVSLHKAGETFLEVTTPVVEVLASVARNSDFAIAALVGLGAGAILVSGKLAVAGLAVLGFNAKLLTLRATMLTLLPVAAAIAVAIAAIAIKKAVLDSLDTASVLMDKQANSQEALTKSTEVLSKARIESTKQEVVERTALISKFVSSEEKLLKRSAQLFAIESKAIGAVFSDTLTDLETKRVKAIKVVKDAVTGMDDAIKGSQQIIKETQEAIAKFDFQKNTKHLNDQQKLWAQLARNEKKATAAAREYRNALANEADTIGARRLSKIAEANARQNLADAERLGNVSTIARAEQAISKILNDRLKGERTFVNERKALDTSANRLALNNLEEQGKKLKSLLELRAKLLSPADDDGVLKDPSQIKADTARAESLKDAIADAFKGATDFDFVKSLKIEDLGTKLTSQMESAVQDATFRWDRAVTSLETQLTAKSYAVNVVLSIDDGLFKAEFEKSFGELNLADPKALDQIGQVSERILAEQEEAQQSVATSITATRNAIDGLSDAVDSDIWSNWSDAFTDSQEAGRLQIEGMNKELSHTATVGETIRRQWSEVKDIFTRANAEQRNLTAEELKQINFVIEYNKEQEAAGKLSENRLRIAKASNVVAQKAVSSANERARAEAKIKELGDAPVKAAENLKKIENAARDFNAEEKKVKAEVDGVTDSIKASKRAADQIPGAAKDGANAIAREADEALRLKTNLQGAAAAQQKLSQTKSQAQPATTVIQEAPKRSTEPATNVVEGVEAATEALKPLIKGIEDVKQSSEGAGNNFGIRIINGVTQAMPAIQTLDGAVVTLAGTVGTVTANVGAVNTAASTTANTVRLANDNTSTWATGMGALATAAQGVVLAMQAAEQAAKRAAQATALAAAAAGGGAIGTAFSGGPAANYMAAGGPTSRGRDTIPVMTAPGEFITNARNSRRFAAELQAMNAGKEPIFRDKGGSVTNVGDINVSVTQGETANNTARQIASSLRRELRRGTSRL